MKINIEKAIDDVREYQKIIVPAWNKMNTIGPLNETEKEEIEFKYEVLIRPILNSLNLADPGHHRYIDSILEYNDPCEYFVKVDTFTALTQSKKYLVKILGRLEYLKNNPDSVVNKSEASHSISSIEKAKQAIRMFDTSAKILSERRQNKIPFKIEDEYDMQDLLHCILKSQLPDIIKESHTIEIAKGEKRIDLVIPSARIVIELKIIFEKRKTLEIVDQLKIDIESYHSHPHCGTLIGFIYNPQKAIEDPEKIINDLSGTRTKGDHVFEVIIEIYPK